MQKIKSFLSTNLLIVLLMTMLSYFGTLTISNLAIYDLLLNKIYKPIPAQTTIFEYDQNLDFQQVQRFISVILAANPKSILLFLPDNQVNQHWNDLSKLDNVDTAKILGYAFSESGHAKITETSTWRPSSGYVLPLRKQRGISRTPPLTYSNEEQTFNSFLLLQGQSEHIEHIKDKYINFLNIPKHIPLMSITRLTSENVAQSFANQKFIIIAPHSSLSYISIDTPFNYQGLGPNEVQYQAMARDAVIHQSLMSPNHLLNVLTLALIIALVLQMALTKTHIRWSKFLILGVTLTLMPAIIYVYLKSGILPPVVEVIIAIFVSSTAFFHEQRVENKRLFSQLNHQILTRLKDSILPKSFIEAEDPWSKIAVMVQQQLRLERSIFLEKVPKDHRVREINAINCSIEDIVEQRRDFHREPYKSALAARTLTKTNRPYFKEKQEQELEFLVPFLNGVDVLGFWALTVIPDKRWNRKKFANNIENFSAQISLLLFHKQRWTKQSNRSLWGMITAWFYSESHYADVLQNTQLLTKKVDFSHRMFATMHTATVIFDLFGQVVEINHAMEKFAEKSQIPIFNLSALDLLAKVTKLNKDIVRAKLRQILLHQTHEHLATTIEIDNESFIVSVKPVLSKDDDSDADAPFRVLGILCEFFNVAEVRNIQNIERNLYEQFFTRIKNHLSTIQMGHLQVERKQLDHDTQVLCHVIQQELQNAATATRRTHELLRGIITKQDRQLVPFDVFETINVRVDTFTENSQDPIEIDKHFPSYSGLGFGNPQMLSTVVDLALRVLAEDAVSPKQIHLYGKHVHREDREWLFIRMSNSGYGLPKDYLDNLSTSETHEQNNSDILRLVTILQDLEDWNMHGRINSKLGKGLVISLVFEGVYIDDR